MWVRAFFAIALLHLPARCICADGKRIALLIGNRDYARSPTRSTTFALSGRRSHEPTSRAASLAAIPAGESPAGRGLPSML